MKPITDLLKEHGAIKLVLKIIDKMSLELEKGKEISVSDIKNIVVLVQEFSDKCHHGKEEHLLFPAMRENNILEEISLIDILVEEHRRGRGFAKNMAEFETTKDPIKFIENARGYIKLLNSHIDKENNLLFPMANKTLAPEKQNELEKGFEDLEKNVIGAGRHEEFHKMISELEKKYLR